MGGLQADGKDLIGHEGFDQMGGVWSDARGRLNLFFKIYAKRLLQSEHLPWLFLIQFSIPEIPICISD